METNQEMGGVGAVAVLFFILFLTSFFFWAGWNMFVATYFHVPPIDFVQSVGVGFLVGVMRSVFRHGEK